MTEESLEPLEGVDEDTVTIDDVDLDEVRAALESPDPVVRQRGGRVSVALTYDGVDAVRPLTEDLLARLDDESLVVVEQVATALIPISESHQDDFEGHVGKIVSLIDDESGNMRVAAAQLLSNVAAERPEFCAPHVDDLIAFLEETDGTYGELDLEGADTTDMQSDDRESLNRHRMEESKRRLKARAIYANVVVAVSETRPAAVRDHVDGLVALLDDDDPRVVGAAADALGHLGAADPEPDQPIVDPLVGLLDHDVDGVRARAIKALGFIEDPDPVPQLWEVAETDENEDVRDLAAETASFIESD